MNSMKRTTSERLRASAAKAGISRSVKPRIATTLILIGRSSGKRSAAEMPRRTRSSAFRRVISAKRTWESESSEMLMRLRPLSTRAPPAGRAARRWW
jgi:hypothetical protein